MDINTLVDVVKKAGLLSLEYYGGNIETFQKEDASPFTKADTAVHTYLTAELEKTGIPVLSEEGVQEVVPKDGMLWVIDPIDGTKDFIHQTDEFSVMVALVKEGVPVQAVVYAPALDELYYAEKGNGAHRVTAGKMEQLSVSSVEDLKDATFVVSRNHGSPEHEGKLMEAGVTNRVPIGSIGIKLGEIAKGSAEIYVNDFRKLGWWDVAAPQLILEEAGGMVTGMDGNVCVYSEKPYQMTQGVVASNGLLHDAVHTCFKNIEV